MKFEIGRRNLTRVGTSYYVALPAEWIRHHQLSKGASITVTLDEQERLLVEPTKMRTHDD